MEKILSRVAAVWIIVIGGIIFSPGRLPQCTFCGGNLNVGIGVTSIILGAAVLISGLKTKQLA